MISDIFTDIFTIRDNALTRVDPRVKIMITATAMTLAIMSHTLIFPLVLFILSASLTIAIGVPFRFVMARLTLPLGAALVIFAIKSFVTVGEPVATYELFLWTLTASREGVIEGLAIAARMLGALSALQLLSVTTPAHQIFRSLKWFRLPHGWIEVAMLIYRYTFELLDTVISMCLAQKVRLGYSTLKRSVSSSGSVVGGSFLIAYDKACSASQAMTARGFNGKIHFDPMKPLGAKRVSIVAVMAFTLVATFIICEGI